MFQNQETKASFNIKHRKLKSLPSLNIYESLISKSVYSDELHIRSKFPDPANRFSYV